MTAERSVLIADVRPGESIVIADGVAIELVHKSGQVARLRISAPRDVPIERGGSAPRIPAPSMAR